MWHIQYECIQSIAWIHLVQILQWWEFGVVVGEAGKQGLECVLICSKVFMSILCIPCLLAALVACLTKVRNSVWWKLSICSHFWQILSFWALLSWHSKCYETLWKEDKTLKFRKEKLDGNTVVGNFWRAYTTGFSQSLSQILNILTLKLLRSISYFKLSQKVT